MSGRQYPLVPSNTATTGPVTYVQTQKIVVDGSTAANIAGSWAQTTLVGIGGIPSASLAQALYGTNAVYSNVAVNAQTFATMIANAAANVDPLIDGTKTNNILIVAPDWFSETSAAFIADYSTYCTARRAAGWTGANKIVVVGVMPSATIPANTLKTINAGVLAAWTGYADAFFDPSTNVYFGEVNAQADARLFLSDQTTLTENGNMALADGIINAVGLALGI